MKAKGVKYLLFSAILVLLIKQKVSISNDLEQQQENNDNPQFNEGEVEDQTRCINPKEPKTCYTRSKISRKSDLPDEFFWGNTNGRNYLTYTLTQKAPHYCGGCWALAAANSLSDRIKIMRNGTGPDIIISPQILLSCVAINRGCWGGQPWYGYQFIQENFITDETCSVNLGYGHQNGLQCKPEAVCSTCKSDGECKPEPNGQIYGIKSYQNFKGELEMMKEIYFGGPIVCMQGLTNDLRYNYDEGIYTDPYRRDNHFDHVTSVVGWGVENGKQYWIIRNTVGSNWGEQGFYRLERGQNNYGIENACVSATPVDTWSEQDRIRDVKNEFLQEIFDVPIQPSTQINQQNLLQYSCRKISMIQRTQTISNALMDLHQRGKSLPKIFDWRNVGGESFLSPMRNQHIPSFCRSCWVLSPISAFNDRINIMTQNQHPTIFLNAQTVLECSDSNGSCAGGDPEYVYQFAVDFGITQESCNPYIGQNKRIHSECSQFKFCYVCNNPKPQNMQTIDKNCTAETKYKLWKAESYGRVIGINNLKAEIMLNGPVTCGIYMTNELMNFNGGARHVFSQQLNFNVELKHLNYEVSIVGWGIDEESIQYWIVRNNLGTHWGGNNGFFNIKIGSDNLGIETSCLWIIPKGVEFKTHFNKQQIYDRRKDDL